MWNRLGKIVYGCEIYGFNMDLEFSHCYVVLIYEQYGFWSSVLWLLMEFDGTKEVCFVEDNVLFL